ncbi:MAG: hypothetical protein IJY58_04105 [Alphaproteobacteria bacterium]|nr:hypothetical protein [Alphaproteobacteria bacterium]
MKKRILLFIRTNQKKIAAFFVGALIAATGIAVDPTTIEKVITMLFG